MSTGIRNEIRREVLEYVSTHGPVSLGTLADALREKQKDLSDFPDSDFRAVVQPMIVTGRLSYTPDLQIQRGNSEG
jgi:hypothetical protein